MNGLIAWWVKNPIAANLMMVAIIIAGVYGYFRIEREVFPSASFTGATISVAWPGASPREIEEQVIFRIEEAIAGIDGVEHVDATARENGAEINVEGDENADPTTFLNDIKNRVDGISTLPVDAFPPVVSQWRSENGALFLAVYGDLTDRELNRLVRRLRDDLSQIPGGSPLVSLWGAQDEEVSIEVSEEALQQYSLTFDDVAQAIRGSSLNIAAGQVKTDTGNIQVAARSLADSEQDFEDIIVRQAQDGSVVRVKDVATVIDDFVERKQKRELNGKPTISIAVNAPETVNIVALSKAVNGWVEKTNAELDGEATIYVWFDTATLYFERMELVSSDALAGIVLVLIVLLLFLRPVVAFWTTAGVLVSVCGAFIFMPVAGVSLNMLSLFAFLLVTGVLCDDAIVVGESIHNQVEEGKRGIEASILGAQLVAKPVFFAVLTTMIAFLPWVFISGGTSQFTKHITLTVIFALTFSLIEAFFILPSHLGHMKPIDRAGLLHRLQGFFSDGMLTVARKVYRPLVTAAVKFRYMTVATFIVAFTIASALLFQGWIAFKFMPEVQGTFISLSVRLPEGAPYSRSLEIFREVEDAGKKLKAELGQVDGEDFVKSVYINASEGAVASYVTIIDGRKRSQSTEEIAALFRSKLSDIPDAEEINVTYTVNDGGPDFTFGIESNDLENLRVATLDVQNFLRTLPGAYDVRNSLQSETPELQIKLLPGAERFGLTLANVSRQVRQAFYGEEVQRLPRGGQDVRVMVRYPAAARQSLTTIEEMRVRTPDGREVPLLAVAEAEFAPSFKRIDRRDRKRSAEVTAELAEGSDRAAINKLFFDEFVPEWKSRHPGVDLAARGEAEGQAEFLGEFFSLYAVALVAMYMVIAIAFGSYWQPILIMSAIPFGFMGAVFGHYVFGLDFGIFSFFGVGAAAGVVINDNLVLIDAVNRLRATGEGALAALVKAGVSRFRPIILTQITTFIGLLPIMGERSTDAQFLMPTVVSLAWGVMMAAFVTLLFVPAMYAVGVDIARFYRWAWTGKKQAEFGQGKSLDTDFDAEARRPKKGPPPVLRPAE